MRLLWTPLRMAPHRVATLVMDALVFLMTPETAEAEADQAPA